MILQNNYRYYLTQIRFPFIIPFFVLSALYAINRSTIWEKKEVQGIFLIFVGTFSRSKTLKTTKLTAVFKE